MEPMNLERPEPMEQEEQIMIMLDGIDEAEDGQDLLEQLVAEPRCSKKSSSDSYDYQPSPIPTQDIEETETTGLKTSNTSTSTCAQIEVSVRRCFCVKTRCQKNYCECFKQGLSCTSQCECIGCCNKERLFLTRTTKEVIKCKCPKSHCLKKYCQCYSAGRKCGPHCKCCDCHNLEQPIKQQAVRQTIDIDNLLFFPN